MRKRKRKLKREKEKKNEKKETGSKREEKIKREKNKKKEKKQTGLERRPWVSWAAMHSRHTLCRCNAKLVTADEHKHTYATFIVTVKSTVCGVQELKGAPGPSR